MPSIHSPAQLEWFKNNVNDKSIKVGGLQCITTLEDYVIPLNIVQGLPQMTIHPFSDQEWEDLPHVILTSELDWDPGQLDVALEDDDQWFDAINDLEGDPFTNLYDEFGNYHHCVVVQSTDLCHLLVTSLTAVSMLPRTILWHLTCPLQTIVQPQYPAPYPSLIHQWNRIQGPETLFWMVVYRHHQVHF